MLKEATVATEDLIAVVARQLFEGFGAVDDGHIGRVGFA